MQMEDGTNCNNKKRIRNINSQSKSIHWTILFSLPLEHVFSIAASDDPANQIVSRPRLAGVDENMEMVIIIATN